MTRRLPILALLLSLLGLALVSLDWGVRFALLESKDLMYRRAEVERFVQGDDPYQLPTMTYPPSALAVFAPLLAPFGPAAVKPAWLGLNLIFVGVLCGAIVALWGRSWPPWLRVAFCLTVVASKPVRGGIALGQFHLIPTAMMLVAVLALRARRPVVAGLLVAVALAKPTMVLPFLGFLAVRQHWRALGVALGVQAAALL